MFKEKTETKEKSFVENPLKKSENTESKVAGSPETSRLSADFRETLLKSGLDVSSFEAEKSETADSAENKSPAISATDLAKDENNFAENKPAQVRSKLQGKINQARAERGWRWQHLAAIGGILTIIILQSIFQFSFIKNDGLNAAEDLKIEQEIKKTTEPEMPKIETSEQTIETASGTASEPKTPALKISARPEKILPKARREPSVVISKAAFRKKDPRQPAGARLRRAEKLLTGF